MSSSYSEQEIRERLSISTYVYRGFRPLGVRAFEELVKHGIRRVELWESPGQYDLTREDSMQNVFEACEDAGVEICAYHASSTNLSDIDTDKSKIQRLDCCKRQIDTLLAAGGTIWGSHIREIDGEAQDCIRELLRYVEGTEAVIVLENFAREGMYHEDRMEFINAVDHPQLGLLLDIGHVRNEEGENPMALPGGPSRVLELCGPKLYFLHLHGFVDGTDHYPPFAEGDGIQWQELFDELHAIDYRGYFNFEPKGPAYHDNTLELTSKAPKRIAEML